MMPPASILMINNNNKLPRHQLSLALLLTLLLSAHAAPSPHSTQLRDLPVLTLHRQDQNYLLPLTINHHTLRLTAQLQAGRSWLKEALCKVCDLATQQCKQSCFTDKDASRISCDSSFCSEVGDYVDESRGLSGQEGEVFLKIGDSSQVLMPLILATKLYQPHAETGQFFLFDPESSFSSAIITRTPQGSIELHNLEKMEAEELERLQQGEGKPLNVTMSGEQFDFTFLKTKNVVLHHVSNASYANFTDDNQYEVAFSLQALPIVFPLKLAKKVERYINEVYLPGKKCRLLPKKLKCSGSIEMQEIFRTVFHFHLNEYVLPIPLHLLVTACSSNECTTLINFDESSQNTITFGTVIWQLYNLQYNLQKKYAIFHRRISQYDDLFLLDKIELSQAGFGYKLLLIVYHAFRYLLIALFWLAVFSIVVNAILKWRSILSWFRDILIRRKQRRVSQRQQQELYQQKPLRKISKLPDPLEDSETV